MHGSKTQMGTSSGLFSLKCTRDTSLFLEEKETTYIASNGRYAKELRATVLTGRAARDERAARPRARAGRGQLLLMASIAVTSSLSGPDKLMHREHILDTCF